MKIKKISFHNIIEGIKNVMRRFPLPVIFSVMTCVLFIVEIESGYKYIYKQHVMKAVFISILGFLLSLAIKLFSEKKGYPNTIKSVINIIMLIFLVYLFFTLPLKFRERDFIVMVMFYLSTFMGLMFAYVRKDDSESDFGRYNVDMIIRLTISVIFSHILFAGVASAIFAIEKLFDFGIHGELYGDIYIIASTIFAPLYFLAGIPDRKERTLENFEFPKAMKVLTLYILLPLVMGYIGILYIYMFKVIFTQDWPKGIVSYLIISYSFVGINSLILSAPLKKSEKYKGLETYTKYFFRALIPLIIMLFFAISKRIGQYGITEKRYFIIFLALWLFGVSVYFVVNKNAKLKYLPISLSIILLLSLFGPWSCFNVSMASQKGRLEKLLVDSKILVDGKIIKDTSRNIPFADRKGISSIVSYFYDTHGIDKVEFLTESVERLEKDTLNLVKYDRSYRDKGLSLSRRKLINEGFGFRFITRGRTALSEGKNQINFSLKTPNNAYITEIDGYTHMIKYSSNYYNESLILNEDLQVGVSKDSMQVIFNYKGKDFKVDLEEAIKGIISDTEIIDKHNNLERERMRIERTTDSINYLIMFNYFTFTKEDDEITMIYCPSFTMYFKLK